MFVLKIHEAEGLILRSVPYQQFLIRVWLQECHTSRVLPDCHIKSVILMVSHHDHRSDQRCLQYWDVRAAKGSRACHVVSHERCHDKSILQDCHAKSVTLRASSNTVIPRVSLQRGS